MNIYTFSYATLGTSGESPAVAEATRWIEPGSRLATALGVGAVVINTLNIIGTAITAYQAYWSLAKGKLLQAAERLALTGLGIVSIVHFLFHFQFRALEVVINPMALSCVASSVSVAALFAAPLNGFAIVYNILKGVRAIIRLCRNDGRPFSLTKILKVSVLAQSLIAIGTSVASLVLITSGAFAALPWLFLPMAAVVVLGSINFICKGIFRERLAEDKINKHLND